jgi:hypothetical protein
MLASFIHVESEFPFESELIRRCIYARFLDFLLLFKKPTLKQKLFHTKNYELFFTLNHIYHILLLYIKKKLLLKKNCIVVDFFLFE